MKRTVAVLGATGLVGRKMISLLDGHPWLELSELRASDRSAGMEIAGIRVKPVGEPVASDIVLSALPAEIAAQIELSLAREGKIVITKASALRTEPDVPVLIPEVNPDHLSILPVQQRNRGLRGAVVADPNCTTTGLAMALKPLYDAYGIESVIVTTMQAVSGAGIRGVGALEVVDNVLPYIGGEEEKVESEPLKILGTAGNGSISPAAFKVKAACHRVAVLDGHTETVHVRCLRAVTPEEAKERMRAFSGLPQKLCLPLAPQAPLIVRDEPDRPQPRLDRDAGKGMAVTVGRVRQGLDGNSLLFDVVSHNLVRGAAGASVLDAELLVKTGKIDELLSNAGNQR